LFFTIRELVLRPLLGILASKYNARDYSLRMPLLLACVGPVLQLDYYVNKRWIQFASLQDKVAVSVSVLPLLLLKRDDLIEIMNSQHLQLFDASSAPCIYNKVSCISNKDEILIFESDGTLKP
jgi:hypothetical protein